MVDTCVLGNRIAGGNYGTIYWQTGADFVTKVYEEFTSAEIDILFRLRSPYLAEGRVIRTECKQGFAVEMERLVGLGTALAGKIPYLKLKRVLLHYALGLRCLHRNNYLHLDLSDGNCMYQGSPEEPVGKLIDFGLAAATSRTPGMVLRPVISTQLRITATYRAPECWKTPSVYTDKADVFSLGMVFLELLSQRPPFNYLQGVVYNTDDKGKHIIDYSKGTVYTTNDKGEQVIDYNKSTLYTTDAKGTIVVDFDTMAPRLIDDLIAPAEIKANLTRRLATIPIDALPLAIDLLINMLNQDPVARYSIEQVVDHPYFGDIKTDVRATTGDMCTQVNVLPSSPEVPFSANHRVGLNYLLQAARTGWRWSNTEFLFDAIDVYLRATSGVGPEVTPRNYIQVALASLIVTHKLFYANSQLPSLYLNQLPKDALSLEVQILSQFGGIIRRPYIYAMCRSIEEVQYIYRTLFVEGTDEDLGAYLRLDLGRYFSQVRTVVPDDVKKVNDPHMRLSTFFTSDEAYLKALDDVYFYVLNIILKDFKMYHTAFMMQALHMFMRVVASRTSGTVDTLKDLGLACIISAHITTYRQEILPEPYSRESLPSVYKLKDALFYMQANENPFYEQSTTPDELRVMYVLYLVPRSGGHYIAPGVYPTLNAEALMATIRALYSIREEPKAVTIEEFLKIGAPSRRK